MPLHSAAIRPRSVQLLVTGEPHQVGDIFTVRRTVGSGLLDNLDPFLMLDHFDSRIVPNDPGGLAPHPHRGFETVTILLEGGVEHRDSLGNKGEIFPGDIQWMTAGGGIVHSENLQSQFRVRGGRLHGIQLWVNLPKRDKLTTPRYQDTRAAALPNVVGDGVRARVFAGEVHGASAVIGTHTPMALVHYTLAAGAEVTIPLPEPWNAFVHVVRGAATVAPKQLVNPGQLAVMRHDGDGLHVVGGPAGAEFLLGAGQPIGEPIVAWGPFVMNTMDEIRRAAYDYRSGAMGHVTM